MNPTLTALLKQGPVILDGAWGTQLQARGLEPGQCPEDWNLIHEDRVRDVAQAYVHAGSQVILTNTFGASRTVLQRHGLDQFVKEINRAGAQISREAAGNDALVFASVGPTGKILMNGDMTVYEMECVFQEQVEALAEGGIDGFVIETMAELEEAQIALKAAQSIGKPVVVSMVYDSGRDRDRTMMGVTPEQATESLDEWGADIIGANCGNGIEGFLSLGKRIRSRTQKPVWLKANAGLPVIREAMTCYETTPEQFARAAIKLADMGASFIGGCCGTSPDHIRALAAQLASRELAG
ncbi:homocysteine S-methyltransferase family protein [Kamptonema cortianum]|nr:homocysteine S-methyltransferase family protein [Kamptonema cortianum]MDL5046190.1 homocysteine S-methyltransferase family protein [Oscillatoria amoena NRMC-F 0135]